VFQTNENMCTVAATICNINRDKIIYIPGFLHMLILHECK